MKRVIDGRTYNTETSTLVAACDWTNNNQYDPHYMCECSSELYQTRGGAFFLVTTIETGDEDRPKRVSCEAMTSDQAHQWILKGDDVEILQDVFGEPPEAEAEEPGGATLYVRIPASLKRSVDEAAKNAGVSGNAWAMRCIERCLSSQ